MSKDILDELPALAKGEAIISGVAINTPTMVKVRPRLTEHGGISRDAPEEWAAHWKKAAALKVTAISQKQQYKLF
jgi:DNA helicase HerA-like ATPase